MCRPRRDEAYYNSREQIPGLSQDDNFPLAQRGKHVTNAAESLAQPRAIKATRKSLSDTSRADGGTKQVKGAHLRDCVSRDNRIKFWPCASVLLAQLVC